MLTQKVVRTATPENGIWYDDNKTKYLQDLLMEGYRVVMCNTIRRKDGQEWLEYILEKEVNCD